MQSIISAVGSGDIQEVADKISSVQDVNALFSGETLLTTAAATNDRDMVKFLIDSGCDPLVKNRKGRLPSEIAMSAGRADLFKVLKSAEEAATIAKEVKAATEQVEPFPNKYFEAIYFNLSSLLRDDRNRINEAVTWLSERSKEDMDKVIKKVAGNQNKAYLRFAWNAVHGNDLSAASPNANGALFCAFLLNQTKSKEHSQRLIDAILTHKDYTRTMTVLVAEAGDVLLKKLDKKTVSEIFYHALAMQPPNKVSIADCSKDTQQTYAVLNMVLNNFSHKIEPKKVFNIPGSVILGEDEILDKIFKINDVKYAILSKLFFSSTNWGCAKEELDVLLDKGSSLNASLPAKHFEVPGFISHLNECKLKDVDVIAAGLTLKIPFRINNALDNAFWLQEHGISIMDAQLNGKSLLNHAMSLHNGALSVIGMLENGFKPNDDEAFIRSVFTYLDGANIYNSDSQSLVKTLDAHGYIDMKNSDGNTLLILAAESTNYGLCKALLKQGASPLIENDEGKNALAILGANKSKAAAVIARRNNCADLIAEAMSDYQPKNNRTNKP